MKPNWLQNNFSLSSLEFIILLLLHFYGWIVFLKRKITNSFKFKIESFVLFNLLNNFLKWNQSQKLIDEAQEEFFGKLSFDLTTNLQKKKLKINKKNIVLFLFGKFLIFELCFFIFFLLKKSFLLNISNCDSMFFFFCLFWNVQNDRKKNKREGERVVLFDLLNNSSITGLFVNIVFCCLVCIHEVMHFYSQQNKA